MGHSCYQGLITMISRHDIELQTGQLKISVHDAKYPLEELLTFGARQNPKRRYLFMSKVLGKYVPCLPSDMRKTYQLLAKSIVQKIKFPSTVWVLGIAETATGLGAGVAQELARCQTQNVIYSHTTRYHLKRDMDFSIFERHSHAPDHLIYRLDDTLPADEVESIVFVDDEISTGKTLDQLTKKFQSHRTKIKHVFWVSLVNWLSEDQRDLYRKEYPLVKFHFISLLDGSYSFLENNSFKLQLPDQTAIGISRIANRDDIGRTGYLASAEQQARFYTPDKQLLDINLLDKDKKYIVLGTGEFTYYPFLFAEKLQNSGFNVLFQSTGRSPILEGKGVKSKQSFFDEAQEGIYYLYNQPKNRQTILLYETIEQYLKCPFWKKLSAITAILERE